MGDEPAAALTDAAQTAAQAAPQAMKVDTGDTAWMLTSTALVLMMTIPGLALFYGGLVRSKNILSMLMHSLFSAALVSVLWVVVGYSIAFGATKGGWCGGLDLLMLKGVMGTNNALAPTIPALLFVAYQLTFAVITPALISGAFAERMRFPAFALFTTLWALFIYAPLAHWVWGGGWIATKIGALDFAGGTVVHISSGISALVTAMYLGKRVGYGHEPMTPHNLPFTVIGAGLLWVGWFGFNAGSALGSNELASIAMLNTNTAAAAAALGWLGAEVLRGGKPTILGAASGAVAGLVVITPAAGFVTPGASIIMGALGGMVCYAAVSLKPRLGYDDALDVVGVHFVGGTLGALLTGVFATSSINSAIPTLTAGAGNALGGQTGGGLLYGNGALLAKQAVAVGATILYCGVGTLVLLAVTNAITKVRAIREEEIDGLDLSQHTERAYAFGGGETAAMAGAEPKPAMSPPIFGERFTVALEGVDAVAMMDRWRTLCQESSKPASAEFKDLYARVTTVRGTRFRFRGGDRDSTRKQLQSLFNDLGPGVNAKVEDSL
ncbi:MAG: ammonium transporter [Planctomycetota bacterium]|nr:ammonium transporter [Planctomycetota bacterium]